MRVLIACEFSGIVRDAFIAQGHEAVSCDLLPTEKPGPHYQGDVRDILGQGWDMMIAHPPCTLLSHAGARFLYAGGVLNQERYEKGLEYKEFFMTLFNAPIAKICIENPLPSPIYELPKCSQIIQPYEYGHPYRKKTYLWLRSLPPLFATVIFVERESTKNAKWFNKGGKNRQSNRAKTFSGIAQAMASQWSTQ